jgi:hypothetical protein
MAAKRETEQLSPKEYGTFIQGLELLNVLLSETHAKRISFPESDSKLGVEFGDAKAKRKLYKDGFTVTASYEIRVTQQVIASGDEAAAPITFGLFKVTFELMYTSQISLTEPLFEIFKHYNLPLNVWPYVRQHVHQQSVLMGLPALVLPVYRTHS